MRVYFVPCPHCSEFQRLTWPNVRWPDGKPELASYWCSGCGAEILESQKFGMISAGEWRATAPFMNGIAGFHISELYSPWSTWAEMAVSFLRAKPFPETLQSWINTSLGETWEDKGETLEPAGLAARIEAYNVESVPAGVLCVVAGIDVQDDRIEVTAWGFGREEECWRLGHTVYRGDPGGAPLWQDVDNGLRARYSTDDGRQLAIEAAGVDTGGHFTDQVYRFCHARKRRRVFAVKGMAGMGRPIWPPKASRAAKLRVSLWLIGVDTAKNVLYGRLKRITEPGPGYLHFDADTSAEYLAQLTSETLCHKVIAGRRVRFWKPRSAGIRQEALDCLVYAYAAFLGRGGPLLMAQRLERDELVPVEPEPPAPTAPEIFKRKPEWINRPPSQRGSAWVKGWRK